MATGVLAIGTGMMAMNANAASGPPGGWNPADPNNPSSTDLVNQCAHPDAGHNCTDIQFNPTNYWTTAGPQTQVGQTAYNCGNGDSQVQLSWTHTEGQSNSVEVSITAEATLFKVVSTSISATYGHTWDFEDSFSQTDLLTVPAKEVGWITLAPNLQNASGDLIFHFDPYYANHGWWKVENYVQTGPEKSGAGSVFFNSRPMTSDELAQCQTSPAGATDGGTVRLDGKPAPAGGQVTTTALRTVQPSGTPSSGRPSLVAGKD